MGGINLLFEMVGKTTGKIAQKKTTGGEYLMNKTLTSSLNSCPQPGRRTHAERKPLDYKSNALPTLPTPRPEIDQSSMSINAKILSFLTWICFNSVIISITVSVYHKCDLAFSANPNNTMNASIDKQYTLLVCTWLKCFF